MSSDIEDQLARHEKEEVNKLPDSSPDRSGCGSCWSSVYPVLVKAVAGAAVLLAIVVYVSIAAAAFACLFASIVAAVSAVLAIAPLLWIIAFSLPKKTHMRFIRNKDKRTKEEAELAGGIGGMYERARQKEPLWYRLMFGSFGIIARASLGALVWLALSLLVPRLRAVRLLGSPMWKWSLLAVTLTAGYFEALLFTVPSIYFVFAFGTTSYYYMEKMMFSINHVAYLGLVLGTWLAYFRTHHGLNHHHHSNPQAFEYLTWSFVSLFVGSVLVLLKNLLLMKWSTDAIYRRFEPRILITSLKFYFIGRLAAHFDENIILRDLKLLEMTQDSTAQTMTSTISKYVMSRKMSLSYLGRVSHILISLGEIMTPLQHLDGEADQEEVVTWFKQQLKVDDTSEKCTMDGLLKLFPSPKEDVEPPELPTSSPKGELEPVEGKVEPPELAETDVKAPELAKRDVKLHNLWSSSLEYWVLKLPSWKIPCKSFILSLLQGKITKYWRMSGKKDPEVKAEKKSEELAKNNKTLANVLWRLVGEECPSSHTLTFDDLNIWLVDAHKDCVNMGRTLADAKAIVTRLDIFISFVIFGIVLLLWLLITGVSSSTVLVTVATPFLALTFMFGDSAKTFFQGFIFCFATHPFDVGDRCILDEVELEVKSISILTTTFMKIGSKEKRLYPNSELATKAIVNLGWQPDPNDMVELLLDPSTNLDGLEEKITEFFKEKSVRYKNAYSLKICEVGEKIKVKIHFSHVLTVHDLSHSQCLKKKSSQQSEFLSIIKKYINESPTGRTNAKDPSQCTASTTIELTNAQK